MRSKFALFIRMKPKRKLLLAKGFFLAFYSYFLFAFNPKLARFGRMSTIVPTEKESNLSIIVDIRFMIKILAKYVPWEFMCRHQAWVVTYLLKKYQVPYIVYVGFKKNTSGIIEGHAWTMAQNIMVSGFCDPDEYTLQAKYVG